MRPTPIRTRSPSNLGAAGLEHFCCVKDTGNIVIQALISPTCPGRSAAAWHGRRPAQQSPRRRVGTDGRTARLSSAAAGKFPHSAELGRRGRAAGRGVGHVVEGPRSRASVSREIVGLLGGMIGIKAGIDHTFKIDPDEVITDADRPALDGPPTAALPGAALRHVASGSSLGGGTAKKWDVSRQVRVRVLNPRLYRPAELSPINPLGHLWNGQPAADTMPENYPANTALGNDDSNSCDETNNPYENCGIAHIRRQPADRDAQHDRRRWQYLRNAHPFPGVPACEPGNNLVSGLRLFVVAFPSALHSCVGDLDGQ